METPIHYVIIYANMNVLAGDRIAVGVIFMRQHCQFNQIGWDKLNNAKSLFNDGNFELVKSKIKDFINPKHFTLSAENLVPYFEHLSIQCNNLITFTKPTPIYIEWKDETLRQFADKYINTLQ